MTTIIDHPVINAKVSQLRCHDTSSTKFRRVAQEISALLVPFATAHFGTSEIEITTPLETARCPIISRDIVLVPILRAGLGLLEGFHNLLPEASVAHIGMARNEETLEPETYYFNAPQDLTDAEVLVLDPMLATGGSAIAAITELKNKGAKYISFVGILSAPEGTLALAEAHPDIHIFVACQDRELNDQGYICPGLGDAGDRIYGTV